GARGGRSSDRGTRWWPRQRPGPPPQLMILPPFFWHSALGTSTTPLPLLSFLPAQLVPAPAHEPWPLQSLIPSPFTLSPPALSSARAWTAPLARSVAAAAAIRIPLLTRSMVLSSSPQSGRSLGCRLRRPRLARVSAAPRSATPSGAYGVEGPGALVRRRRRRRPPLAGAPVARRGNRGGVREHLRHPLRVRRLAHHRAEPGDPEPLQPAALLHRSEHHDGPAREQGPAAPSRGHPGAQPPRLGPRPVELSCRQPSPALDRDAARLPH